MTAPATDAATTQPRPVAGRASSLLIILGCRRWWGAWLRFNFWLGRHVGRLIKPVDQLSFIHFARWAVIRKLAYNGPPQEQRGLTRPYLLFESNFNGSMAAYLIGFGYVLPDRLWAIWGGAFGFPGLKPPGHFQQYIEGAEVHHGHYYCAYPNATTTMVRSALALRALHSDFRAATNGEDAAEFARSWMRFTIEAQRHL